ncbi:MAG: OmpA family protein [Alphaproteobacteria bacterium]
MKWFEDDAPEAAPEQGSASKEFPNLGSVPERPVVPSLKSQQAEIREGLVADQENARYTEEEVRQEVDRRAGGLPQAAGPRVSSVPPAPPPVARPSVPRPEIPAAPDNREVPVTRPGVPPPPSVPAPQSVAPPEPRTAESVAPLPVSPPAPSVVPPPPSVAPPANTTPPATADASPILSEPLKVGTIYFAENAKHLQSADVAILEQIAAAQRATGNRLRVVGHASGGAGASNSSRRSRVNYEVSLSRANAVVSALVSLGVSPGQITVEALGDTAPLYAEYTAAGEAANRRAEIWMMN